MTMENMAEVTINGRPGAAIIWANVKRAGDTVYLTSETDAPMIRDAWFSDRPSISIAVDYFDKGRAPFASEMRISEFGESGGKVNAVLELTDPK